MYKIYLEIDGMMCGMCESHINDTIRRNFNVRKVSSSHTRGRCEILSQEAIDESDLKKAVDATGYKVTGYGCKPYEKKYLRKMSRKSPD